MLEYIKNHFPKLKDMMIFAGWILGILVFGGLLWYLTQDFRDHRMVRTINAVLIQNNDRRRVLSVLSDQLTSGRTFQHYERFSVVGSAGIAVVITMYDNAVPAVCAVFVNSDGTVQDFVPLDDHSAQIWGRLEKTKRDVYTIYIEENERHIRRGD